MTKNVKFEWVYAYKQFAKGLLNYKNNRLDLVNKIKSAFSKNNIKLPTIERNDEDIIDIDPFTIFGFFNKNSMNENNRIAIYSALANELDFSEKSVKSFEGIPVLNAQNAVFFRFTGDISRKDDDINELWMLFETALIYADDPSNDNKIAVSKHFDYCINIKGNGNAKITMGLYWIAPETYINLDSRNQWYIYESGQISDEIVNSLPVIEDKMSAETYFEIIDKIRKYMNSEDINANDFNELSYDAWVESSFVNKEKKKSTAKIIKLFRPLIVAIKDLGGSAEPSSVYSKIIENEHLDGEVVNEKTKKNGISVFRSQVQWAKEYLSKAGYIDKSSKEMWILTQKGLEIEMKDDLAEKIYREVSEQKLNNDKGDGNSLGDDTSSDIQYWIYSPDKNADRWEEFYNKGIMAIGWGYTGDLKNYESIDDLKNAMREIKNSTKSFKNSGLAVWQFSHVIKPGDIIFVKKGMHKIIGRGIVESDYIFDDSLEDFKHIRKMNWTDKGEWTHPGQATVKTLTNITRYTEYVEKLKSLFEDDADDEIEIKYDSYDLNDFLSEVYMDKNSYYTLRDLVLTKKNVILQGAPGVGKTFVAKRLAYSIIGSKNKERVQMVQFHQSYSYEDFIEGFRPSLEGSGFDIKKGTFLDFCDVARDDLDNNYFFIIDEINRGNLSKIFGELFMLIENDKRGYELQLLYSGDKFSVPKNVHIIGMMNTADRSLALVDYALRRRFAFYEMHPGFDTDGFMEYQDSLESEQFNSLISCVQELNNKIESDDSLGEGFCIGHSYFCDIEEASENILSSIIEYEIIPLLKEYWFDELDKVKYWSTKLRNSIK